MAEVRVFDVMNVGNVGFEGADADFFCLKQAVGDDARDGGVG